MSHFILRLPSVIARTGLARSTIYAKLDAASPWHDPTFPQPVRLGGRSVGWLEDEISEWIEQRIAVRGAMLADAGQGEVT